LLKKDKGKNYLLLHLNTKKQKEMKIILKPTRKSDKKKGGEKYFIQLQRS